MLTAPVLMAAREQSLRSRGLVRSVGHFGDSLARSRALLTFRYGADIMPCIRYALAETSRGMPIPASIKGQA